MSTPFVENQPRVREPKVGEEPAARIVGTASMAEAIGSAAAVVLSILALAGALPLAFMSIAMICLGAAFFLMGGAVLARYNRLVAEVERPGEQRIARTELAGGMTAESLAGIAGIALGILSLLGLVPLVLGPISLLGFGGGLLLGSAATPRLGELTYARTSSVTTPGGVASESRDVLHGAGRALTGGEVLVGIGVIVLGILALLGVRPLTLTLVGLLAAGGVALLSGSVFGAKLLRAGHPVTGR